MIFPESGGFGIIENNTRFSDEFLTPHCKTQHNRNHPNFGRGDFSELNLANYPDSGPKLFSERELKRYCHKSRYLGRKYIGDDFSQFVLRNKRSKAYVRFSDFVQTSKSDELYSLNTPRVQLPTIRENKIEIVIPRDERLVYDILIDMSGCPNLQWTNLLSLLIVGIMLL